MLYSKLITFQLQAKAKIICVLGRHCFLDTVYGVVPYDIVSSLPEGYKHRGTNSCNRSRPLESCYSFMVISFEPLRRLFIRKLPLQVNPEFSPNGNILLLTVIY